MHNQSHHPSTHDSAAARQVLPHKVATLIFVAAMVALSFNAEAIAQDSDKSRVPNIVIIFTDDQGYSDVGVFGAEGFATPNLDRMAAEGMRFTDFYVAAPSCSPSRAALLTGCYPLRVSVPNVLSPRSAIGLNPEETTIADLLKQHDYATACVGKWHLGRHPTLLPTRQGFDQYLGLPYSNDMTPDASKNPNPPARNRPPLPLMRNEEVIEEEPDQSTLTQRYTEEAVNFIKAKQDQPFFLYMAHNFPHVPLFASEDFAGRTERGTYGDVIEEIDWSVGQILQTLKETGVAENTLVLFTSDNGPWLVKGAHGGTAKPLREGKGTCFEGGQRVPFIAYWPGKIQPGKVCSEVATAMDFLPTIAALTDCELPERPIDGKDISPLLFNEEGAKSPHEAFLYFRGRELHAVRSGPWKLHVPHNYRSIEDARLATPDFAGSYTSKAIELSLFNLTEDIGETTNVAADHPEIVKRLLTYIEAGRKDLGDKITETPGENTRPPGRRPNARANNRGNGDGGG